MYLMRTMSNLHLLIPLKNSNSIQIAMKEIKEEEERCKVDLVGSQKADDIVSSKGGVNDDEEERCKVDLDTVSSKRVGNEDDDGYHTPTSPRHRIPKAMECPGAPKKPPTLPRKRKRMVCCSVEIADVGLVFGVGMDNVDEGKRVCKKAREEATIDN